MGDGMSVWNLKRTLSQVNALQQATEVPAVNVLKLVAAVPDGDTVAVGERVYECDDTVPGTITAGRVRVPVFMGYATAQLNFDDTLTVANGNTVTIGGKTYTFRTTLTNVDGYVQIGPTTHRTIYNLVAAINRGKGGALNPPADFGDFNDVGEGPGVAYAAAMTVHPKNLRAQYDGDYALELWDRDGGVAGGTIALAATLAGNTVWLEGNFMNPPAPPSANAFGAALVAALNSDPQGRVWAEQISASEVLVWSRRPGVVVTSCTANFTNGGNLWEAAALSGGVPARNELSVVAGAQRVVTAAEAAAGRLHLVFGFEPLTALLQVRSSVGAHVASDAAVTAVGRRVTVTAATVALTAGQVINLVVFR